MSEKPEDFICGTCRKMLH